MIRIRPYEWLHMEVPGGGRMGEARVSGTLYITPKRVVVQGAAGPVWTHPVKDLKVRAEGRSGVLAGPDGRQVTWTSKNTPVAWWGNAIAFWKGGILQDVAETDGLPPAFGDIVELPDALYHAGWRIRRYDSKTLAEGGIAGNMPDTEEFRRTVRHTNIILAALYHDGFPDGPPPAYYRRTLRRHALTHITKLVWGWKTALRQITDVVRGRGHLAGWNNLFPDSAHWPDRWFEPKPLAPAKSEWHHEINPGSCGGHPYDILERCRAMIPVMVRVADELHENPTHNPYLRMRQLYEAMRDGRDIPPPPREALPLARAAAGNPW